jgi:hypothetical protein
MQAVDPIRALDDLRACLLAPVEGGYARGLRELCTRSFLGIECPVCFGEVTTPATLLDYTFA